MLTRQVADYFELSLNTLHTCYLRNKKEIDFDGTLIRSVEDLEVLNLCTSKFKKSYDNNNILF